MSGRLTCGLLRGVILPGELGLICGLLRGVILPGGLGLT